MKINVKSTNLDLTPSLGVYIEEKLGALKKLVKKFDLGNDLVLHIEVARTTKHHHKGEVFMAEGNLNLPGGNLRAVEKSGDIRVAIDLMKHKLQMEIVKFKATHDQSRAKQKKQRIK